jgi:1-acyl-sn-glycerol-3-phosphate acyltransferase
MNPITWFVYLVIKVGLSLLCRMDASELNKVPQHGPLIAISNHTGSLEVPALYAWLFPRPETAWAKAETWDKPFFNWLFHLWDVIPVRRGEADTSALRAALDKLEQGFIFGVAPEGTRNKTGKLLRGHPGVVMLATHSKAPLLPVAHWGGENFLRNLKRLRRTDFHVRVGRQFTLNLNGERITRDQRQQIVDEMMYQLSALLPEEYRGAYSDLSKATTQFLKFDVPVTPALPGTARQGKCAPGANVASRAAAKPSPSPKQEIASGGREPPSQ